MFSFSLGLVASLWLSSSLGNFVREAHEREVALAHEELSTLHWLPHTFVGDHYSSEIEMKEMAMQFVRMKERYGQHLLGAMQEFSQAHELSDLFQYFVALGLPLFHEDGWPLMRELLYRSIHSGGRLMGFSEKSVVLIHSASASLGCRLFDELRSPTESVFDHKQSFRAMTKRLAFFCSGGADYLVRSLEKKYETAPVSLNHLFAAAPTQEGRRFLSIVMTDRKVSDVLVVITLATPQNELHRGAWLKDDLVRQTVRRVLEQSRSSEGLVNAIMLANEASFDSNEMKQLVMDTFNRLPRESQTTLFVGWFNLVERPEDSAWRLTHAEHMAQSLIDGWNVSVVGIDTSVQDSVNRAYHDFLISHEAVRMGWISTLKELAGKSDKFRNAIQQSLGATTPQRVISILVTAESLAACDSETWTGIASYPSLIDSSLEIETPQLAAVVWNGVAKALNRACVSESTQAQVVDKITETMAMRDPRVYVRLGLTEFLKAQYVYRKPLRQALMDEAPEVRHRAAQILQTSIYDLRQDDGFYFQLKESILSDLSVAGEVSLELHQLFALLDEDLLPPSNSEFSLDLQSHGNLVETF